MIYVAIPSYADFDLPNTVLSCIRMASGAIPLRIGVYEQASAHVLTLPLSDITPQNGHMRAELEGAEVCWDIISRDEHQALEVGVGYARAKAASWHEDAEFVLNIDAHSRFEPNWDLELIEQIARLPSDRPLITARPMNNPWARDTVIVDEITGIDETVIIAYEPRGVMGDEWYPARQLSAGFVFGRNWLGDVEPDPHITFWGEQATSLVRLWTHGYDLFHASSPVTEGSIRPEPRPWTDHPTWTEIDAHSRRRCQVLLGMTAPVESDPEIEPEYGLGDRRTLHEFQGWAGIDFADRSFDPDWGDWPREDHR